MLTFAATSHCACRDYTDVMNLLANNEEFRKLVGEFAERMKEILGIDVK